MFRKLQKFRLEVISLDTTLALSIVRLGVPHCTGVNTLDAGSWGPLEVLGDGPGGQRVGGIPGAQASDYFPTKES